MTPKETIARVEAGGFDAVLARLYPPQALPDQRLRIRDAVGEFARLYGDGREVRLFSAPGRIEVGGNHTDHQRGRVLAAAVNLDLLCVASPNEEGVIRVHSKGYPPDELIIGSPGPHDTEKEKSVSLIRGVAARCAALGYKVGGFDAYTVSDVPKGSGLSSSAAFEVAVGTMISGLFNAGAIPAGEIARIGQYAENVYFGKPCGLMDQMASSVGGFVAIDFADPENPVIESMELDVAEKGYAICIVDTKGNHADLTGEYAAIPSEMRLVAEQFGKRFLREVDEGAFWARLPAVRERCGDRAALRAIHFFGDNSRAAAQAAALRRGDFPAFLALVTESGRSSAVNLQNVFACSEPQDQGLSIALAVSETLLAGRGAWRVHGGGFAGTIQAFVPLELVEEYRDRMESLFGQGACHLLSIRPVGGAELTEM